MAEPFAEHQHWCPTHGLWTCTCKLIADRDEWRALARELGAAARHWDTGRNARDNQCDDCETGLAAVEKLREKEGRDAGQ